MATYKPRKLDELNSMYDKSLEAGRSIKQGSQIADASAQSTPPAIEKETTTADITPSQSVASATYEIDPNADISDIANDFILRFGTPERVAATTRLQENETIKAKVKPVSSGPAIKTAVATNKPARKAITEGDSSAPAEPKVRKVTSYRAELMEDYMKVMNDEDDDTPSFFKGRKGKKDKKKKHPKAENEALQQETQQAETQTEPTDETSETETATDISFAELSEGIVESAFGEESSESAEVAPEQTENETEQQEEIATEQATEAEEIAEEQPESEVQQPAQEETDEDEAEPENNEIFSSSDYEDIDIVSHSKPRKEKGDAERKPVKRHILAKTLLSLALVLCAVLAIAVGALKLVVGVDTGIPFAENYYVFTSDKDYTISGIKENDLIIAENFPPEKGNTFAYIDTETQSFGFAKYSDTIINDVSDVLITAETDDSRIAVFRDDIRGVVLKTIPQVGKFVALSCNYYIVIISVLLALALAIVFILALAFKTKYEDDIVIEYSGEEEFDFDDTDDDDDLSLFEEI